MSLKKTQDYLYFQNKASHYHNIIRAKSRLDTKVPESLRNTIDYHDIKNAKKHLPHLREFDIKFTNQTMLKRIISKDSPPLNKHTTYARYNSFERGFRHRSPQRNQQQRLIQIQNMKMKRGIENAKAEVGSIEDWKRNYEENVRHSRLKSKFIGPKSKEQLTIETQKFMPDRYLKYLQQTQPENDQQKRSSQQKSKHKIKGKIGVQKLFLLPHILTPSAQLNNSVSKSKLPSIDRPKIEQRTNVQTPLQN